MTFNWFLIFNLTEFLATNLVSRTITTTLEGLGEKEILIVRGNLVSLVYDNCILPVGFNDDNPFVIDDADSTEELSYAVYKDAATQNVYLGIEVPE